MRIHSISAKNYRPFKELKETTFGQLATIVGKNDAGKSSILRAIELFLDKKSTPEPEDFYDSAATADMIIEASFDDLPETIQIEEGVDTTLSEEKLLDQNKNLRIRKVFSRSGKNPQIFIVTMDIQDKYFAELTKLKETELNKKCKDKDIDVEKSGRGITNKDKRSALRAAALETGNTVGHHEIELTTNDSLWKIISSLLPVFNLFESERKVDIFDTSFQREFRPIVDDTADHPDVARSKAEFTGTIEKALQTEVEQICVKLRKHTDAVTCLTAKPIFDWNKAVTLQLDGTDQFGMSKPLERRGTGIRRLLMVAFFEHLAEKTVLNKQNLIFGIEEPENGLHPGLQRDLASSLQQLAEQGRQIIITTHSPVFAGVSPIDDLVLIVREQAVAKAFQTPNLDLDKVAKELGVEPSDQIVIPLSISFLTCLC